MKSYYTKAQLEKAFKAGYTLAANEWRHSEVCGSKCRCEMIDYSSFEEWFKNRKLKPFIVGTIIKPWNIIAESEIKGL